MNIYLLAFLAHLVGDFLLQRDYIAENKKKKSSICFTHICMYLFPFIFLHLTWTQFLLIGLQHYLIDRYNFVGWYCKTVGSERFLKEPYFPWSYIVVDQIFHLLWIVLVITKF